MEQSDRNMPRPNARRRRQSVFLWGVASTALSAAGMIGLVLFEHCNEAITELRGDLKRFHQTSANYVHQEHLQRLDELMHELHLQAGIVDAARELLEQKLRVSERGREHRAREVSQLNERAAYLEGLHASATAAAVTASAATRPSAQAP